MRFASLIAATCTLAACASHHGPTPPGPEGDIVALAISPTDQELVIDNATPASLTYTLTATYQDGHSEDVSDRASFSLTNPGVGSFAANEFTTGLTQGGFTRVVAGVPGVEKTVDTGLVVRIKEAYPDPGATGLPADPTAPFNGPADASRAPDVVYPNDNVLVPPNLRLLEIHFMPGANNTLFEIAFENNLTDIRVYTRCTLPMNGGCIYTPDATVWQWIAATNRGGDPVVVRVRATDDAGTGVGTSTDTHVAFSYEDVKGAIYYWKASTTSDTAIMRYDFGDVTQTTAQRFVGPDMAGGRCVGCHALSHDGKKLAAAAGGWDVNDSLLVDVNTVTRMATPVKTAFSSWNPDGSAYVGVFAATGATSYDLMVVDGTSGQLKSTIDVGATATNATSHPDWSPDGKSIAFVREGQAYETGVNNQRFYEGGIQIVQDQGGSFGAPVDIVPAVAGKNRYYPSFSPDNKLLVFNESTCPSGTAHQDCDADSDPSATIFVVPPTPGATPIALANANSPGKLDTVTTLTDSWPKWAPFEFQRTGAPGSRVMWMTFSSTRNYGLRKPPPASNTEALSGTLLWMVAIDPDRVTAGGDPSYTAFALPFQDVTSSNHIAQWTQELLQ